MNMRRFPAFALCAALCAALALPLAFPGIVSAAAGDPALQGVAAQARVRAAGLLRSGRAGEAYDIYKSLALNDPGDDEALLGLARSGAMAKHWNQSVTIYEMLIEKYPAESVLYHELAQVYMLLGERGEAERYKAAAESLGSGRKLDLAAMEKRLDQVQFHGRLRAGLLYDSNVNIGPESADMDLGAWHVSIPGVEAQDSLGAYFGVDLDFGWQPWRDEGWWLVGDLRGLWRGYERQELHETLNTRESMWGRLGVGVRYVGGRSLVDLRVREEIFDYEFLQHVRSLGPELTFAYALTPRLSAITAAGWDSRKYSEAKERNGGYGWAGEYVRLSFGEAGHAVTVGGRVLWAATNVEDYDYSGWEGSARLLVKLPKRVDFEPFASVTRELYKGPATALETEDRHDTRWRLGASLTWHIDDAWAVEATYAYTSSNSTCDLYDYAQHLVMTGVSWSF